MGPYGSQNFQTLLLPEITFDIFQTFSQFFLWVRLTKVLFLEIWNFQLTIFTDFFFFSQFTIVPYG